MIYLLDKLFFEYYTNARARAKGPVRSDINSNVNLRIDQSAKTAELSITGVLSETGPDKLDRMLGQNGTAYRDVRDAVETIKASLPDGGDVTVGFNTPGGNVEGLDQTYQALASFGDAFTLTARNDGMTASAGYYLASAADRIEASSLMAATGSVGVVTSFVDERDALAGEGIKIHTVTNSKSPRKRPDPSTDEGRETLIEQMDAASTLR